MGAVNLACQIFWVYNVARQPFWSEQANLDPEDVSGLSIVADENTALWVFGNFQFVVAAMAFNKGAPFLKNFYTNIPFTLCLIAIIACDLAILFQPAGPKHLSEAFLLRNFEMPDGSVVYYSYRWWLFLGVCINSIICYVNEKTGIVWLERFWDARMKEQRAAELKKRLQVSKLNE